MMMVDAGPSTSRDSGSTSRDSAMADNDSGEPVVDDSGVSDAGSPPEDTGPESDSGSCPEGYAGAACDECAAGYHEPRSDGVCVPTCEVLVCGDFASCASEPLGGEALCVCNEGHEGDDCATCSEGYEAGAGGNCGLISPPLGNLMLWLDAADEESITVDSSDLVTRWDDRRAWVDDFAVPTAGISRPAYLAEGRNGRGVIEFDGSTDQMKVDGFTGLSSTDFEIVWAGEPAPTAPTAILGGISGTSNWAVMLDRDTTTDFSMTVRTPAGTTGGETIDLMRNSGVRPMYVFASRKTSGAGIDTYAMWASDSTMDAFEAVPSTTGGIASPLTLRIGRTQAGFMEGQMYEILIYTKRLANAERDEVRAYLRAKWNLR